MPIVPDGPVLVRNTAHAVNGGVVIDPRGASTLPGLYAAGEVAAGPHGADRLGGGMVTNCQVLGARAGQAAAEYARSAARPDPTLAAKEMLSDRLGRLSGAHGRETTAEEVLNALQQETGQRLMVVRDGAGLSRLLACVAELLDERLPHVDITAAAALRRTIEVENSLLTAQMMATAALAREESRGSHFRRDHPRRDDAHWGENLVLRQIDRVLTITKQRLSEAFSDLP